MFLFPLAQEASRREAGGKVKLQVGSLAHLPACLVRGQAQLWMTGAVNETSLPPGGRMGGDEQDHIVFPAGTQNRQWCPPTELDIS